MKFNGATFNKAQQDQLKKKVGADLEAVIAKVDDVDSRMLNYTGDWVTDNEYHENDVVTWGTNGHLYEVIKAHTSSSTIDPSNTVYYKAMTATKYKTTNFNLANTTGIIKFFNALSSISRATSAIECPSFDGSGSDILFTLGASNFNGDLMSLNATKINGDNTIKEFIVKVTSTAVSFFTKEGNTLTPYTPKAKTFYIKEL